MTDASKPAAAAGPVADLRVIEMGQLIAGPFCGQLFADFGAEVIKVEPPGEGDPLRQWGQQKIDGQSLWWPVIGRNKKSVTLNLREADGQEVIRELVKKSDVLIENFRPGTLERWTLGYEQLRAINPRLVMIRVSGFGQTGPRAQEAGFGVIGEAMGGLRHVIGDPDRPPARAGISIGDSLAATFACLGGMMAIHARGRTGRGQVVDSAIYEAVLAMMESLVSEYDKTGYMRERTGATLPKVAPSNVYPCSDGTVLIAGNQDNVFRRLAQGIGQPELATDPRFATHVERGERQAELDAIIAAWTKLHTIDQVIAVMNDSGVPAGKIYRPSDMMDDPHFKAREAIVRVAHKTFGDVAMQNVVPKLSETPGSVRSTGPELGEHNDEIYRGLLGFDDARLNDLKSRGVI
ncbi:CaiB/BaiF CoA transferase family protein [Roseiterribacter gracilis]|uniref:Succinyl-CoA--D-citramalate CoA-transferase n=1 Tax=Roseiterribacter gracilis TaxID=2812848 RepID=A0A8S8XH81_9PROT|nr:succinyl-CoA--D-citramalate CoA-transferase [Rhodospirillales bacterium TMPK1]